MVFSFYTGAWHFRYPTAKKSIIGFNCILTDRPVMVFKVSRPYSLEIFQTQRTVSSLSFD